ncbi:MAG: flippase-like domain-containing protein [Deltaproteobacteria bacterium]|nr:flippase-like domain-containing protein [Deltaproteobacteria bacterium]
MPSEESSPPRPSRRWKTLASAALGLGFTALLFVYLARNTTWADWRGLYLGLRADYFLLYLALFAATMLLKAVRYRVLLQAGDQAGPGVGDLLVVSLATNLFVDLLPARSGSLSYILFLNRRLDVDLPSCVSSFAFAFIFDVVGILPLLFTAILLAGGPADRPSGALWAALAVLAVAALLALFLLDRVMAWAARLAARWAPQGPGRLAGLWRRGVEELSGMAAEVTRIKGRRVYGRLLGLSVLLRLAKYLSLFILVQALAAAWDPAVGQRLTFPLVFFALVAAETTASLPISGIAGFGAYEGVMSATLLWAGLADNQAAALPFALHLLTQTIDYSAGGLALLYLLTSRRYRKS